jgi:TPR repeat protein
MKATRLAWILLLLLLGNGCKEKAVSSTTVIRAKAEKGDAVAQYNLGWSYANGRGVATNDVEAVKWYRMAADQNYALAQSSLGRCYGNGQGVTKNEAEAVKWFRRAAAPHRGWAARPQRCMSE